MEKKEKKLSRTSVVHFVQGICFLLIVSLLFGAYTFIFRDKNEANIVKPFYDEPENSLDIVVIGSSHVMCGFSAMELYDEFGYTSYGFASSSQLLPQSYYQVVAALEVQTPQLLILDVGGAVYGNQLYGSEAYAHVQTDNMPMSLNKINLIQDLFEAEDRLSYYLNLVQFHTRWKELTVKDFEAITSVTKGAYISYTSAEIDSLPYVDPSATYPLSETAENYLRKTIELCQNRGIQLLLINFPGSHSEEDYQKLNTVGEIAREYDVGYLNLQYCLEEMEFDVTTDFRDAYHCNAYGGYKATQYLGNYLADNYDLSNIHSDSIYEKWESDLAAYRELYPVGHCVLG